MCWKPACVLLLLALPAFAGNDQAASPVNPACDDADPTSFDEVYACMDWANAHSRYGFAGNIATSDCQSIGLRYAALLQQTAGMSRQQAEARIPSCEVFARAAEKMKGKPAYWAACLGYGHTPDAAHVKACVEGYIAGDHRSRGSTIDNVQDCNQVQASYERGLRTADANGQLPAGYVPPDCDVAERLLAEWSQAAAAPTQ